MSARVAMAAAPLGVALALLATAGIVACADDDDAATSTPTPDDGATIVEQGTVANLGSYRVGVVRVDASEHSAFVSISRATGEKVSDTTLVIGTPHQLPDGALMLLETRDGGSNRDTIRIRFEPGY